MTKKSILFFLFIILKYLFSDVSITQKENFITVQNNLLKFTIDLQNGARISEYVYKFFGENIVYPVSSAGGMLMDHVWEQTWPGEFLYKKYEFKIIKNTPQEAIISVWTSGEKETTKGLKFERIIILKDNDRVIYCNVLVSNPTKEGRVIGYWNQNNYWFGGKKEFITWARPSTTGIDRMGVDKDGNQWFSERWYYVDDAISGWNGAYNKELKMGMMFLMDYNDLWRIYDNAAAITTEWMYDRVAIPPGKTWKTDIFIIPVFDITGFTHGSLNFVSNFEISEIPGGLKIEHQITKGVKKIKELKIKTRVKGLREKWVVESEEINFGEIDERIQKKEVVLRNLGDLPYEIEVLAKGITEEGEEFEEKYGDYYGGKFGKNLDPFTMVPYLKYEKPKKRKVFLKPDVIKYEPNKIPRILFLRGMWSEFFKCEDAIKNLWPDAEIVYGWLDSSPVGLSLSYFPPDYDSLLKFDLIILGNVPAEPIGLVGEEMIKDYIIAGGNLLILGGDQSFGQAGFTNEELINLIPVEMGGKFNWNKIEDKGILKVASPHEILNGINFSSENPVVFYSHKCKPKKDSEVLIKADDRPIVVINKKSSYGDIACILATPFGESKSKETPFWESKTWVKFLCNLLKYMIEK
jgi:uncharacterized membrane protein